MFRANSVFCDSANNKLVKTYLDYCEGLKSKMILLKPTLRKFIAIESEDYTAYEITRIQSNN
jgi:hypothetical protein